MGNTPFETGTWIGHVETEEFDRAAAAASYLARTAVRLNAVKDLRTVLDALGLRETLNAGSSGSGDRATRSPAG
jgi:hypothetical protein